MLTTERYYNKTNFSGLETHIANSYANPLLQLLRFTTMVRNLALQHTATSCLFDNCLLCELGYLVDMLEKAAGQNCQATNFLKTFSGQPAAQSLRLLEEHAPNAPLTSMIQATSRFLLDKFCMDYRQVLPSSHKEQMEHTLGTKMIATIRCANCNHEQIRQEDVHSHELIYPPKNAGRPPQRGLPPQKFSHILKSSVERQEQTRGWCSRCQGYKSMTQRRAVQTAPSVLMVNANVQNSESKQLWSTPNWLPQEIGVIIGNGQFYCYEGQDLELHIHRKAHNIQVYELIGVVADINSGESQKPHLVSVVNGMVAYSLLHFGTNLSCQLPHPLPILMPRTSGTYLTTFWSLR
jgi:PAB-dependent poly(A)-specific ribonuclease subunit 2